MVPLRVSDLWGSGAVKGKSRCWWRDGRKRRRRRRQRVYKGISRRLSLGDGSQMSDPGPLQLIVKQKTYLLFLSLPLTFFSLFIFIFFLFSLSETCFPLCPLSVSPNYYYFPLRFTFLASVFTLPVHEGQHNLCSRQMANTTFAVEGRPKMTTANKEACHFVHSFFSSMQVLERL